MATTKETDTQFKITVLAGANHVFGSFRCPIQEPKTCAHGLELTCWFYTYHCDHCSTKVRKQQEKRGQGPHCSGLGHEGWGG